MELDKTVREVGFQSNAAKVSRYDLHQVLAATWYEMILQARRGAIWITLITIQAPVIGFALYLSWRTVSTNPTYYIGPQEISFEVTSSIIETLPLVPLLLMAVLPFMLADTIPAERRSNVLEILKHLMLSPGTYLAGKVLGALGVLVVALLATTVIQIVLTVIIVGDIDVLFLVQVTGVLWIPLLIYATSISVLLPSKFTSRRWAWAIAILFSLVGAVSAFPALTGSNSPMIVGLLFPAHAPALWFLQSCSYTTRCLLPLPIVLASILPAVIQGLVVWAIARHWLTRGDE